MGNLCEWDISTRNVYFRLRIPAIGYLTIAVSYPPDVTGVAKVIKDPFCAQSKKNFF